MDRKQQVFVKLKLKAKALGFNVRELKGIAAKIADNLTSADDASEEDVNAEIDSQIDAVLPYLTFGQSQANRLLDEWKKNHPDPDEDKDVDDDKSKDGVGSQNKSKDKDGTPEWAKDLLKTVETLNSEITALKGEKLTTSRKSKLEALLKDTGSFGARTLKSFNKMKFENDEEFEEFYSDVEEDLKSYNQERADNGLSTLGAIPNAGSKKTETELLTDDEIIALAKGS